MSPIRKYAAVLSFSLLASFSLLVAMPALAFSTGDTGLDATASKAGLITGTGPTLPQLIGSLIRSGLGLLGIVFVALILYSGFVWMTARDDSTKIKQAKGIITSAIIGLVIITASYAITSFVINALGNTVSPQAPAPTPSNGFEGTDQGFDNTINGIIKQ